MVKRTTIHTAIATSIGGVLAVGFPDHAKNPSSGNFSVFVVSTSTKAGLLRKIDRLPLDLEIQQIATSILRQRKKLVYGKGWTIPIGSRLAWAIEAKSIRAIWHRWNILARSTIPAGFEVGTFGIDNRIPTAANMRSRLKSLVPTPYNCYLLDRDLRRYLGLELRAVIGGSENKHGKC